MTELQYSYRRNNANQLVLTMQRKLESMSANKQQSLNPLELLYPGRQIYPRKKTRSENRVYKKLKKQHSTSFCKGQRKTITE